MSKRSKIRRVIICWKLIFCSTGRSVYKNISCFKTFQWAINLNSQVFWDLMRKKPETIIRQMQQPHYFTVVLFQFRTEDVFKYDYLCKLKHVFCCLYSDQFVPDYHCKWNGYHLSMRVLDKTYFSYWHP